ncbi:MAG: F0F1 ATP synthase subunit B [Actinomycetota bacterium]
MADVTVWLLAAEAEPSGLDLILPATEELIWGAICFAVVAYLLSRFAFPRLREAVQARETTIQNALEETEKAKSDAQGLLDDYKKQLADARAEANRVIEDSRQQAEDVRRDLIARAEKDAEGVVARAREQIEAERNRTVQELQGQIADMSIDLAEKVVGRSLDGKTQRELVDAYIKEVSGMSGNGSTS